ncbi:MAG: cyclic lactone autoinducer peptide [Firmicutes bacterium]|nr:cyclic lactone autoinducer peptide [Bacillota bacterium]
MRKLFLSLVMAALSVVCFASMVSACHLWGYQPKVPSSLKSNV